MHTTLRVYTLLREEDDFPEGGFRKSVGAAIRTEVSGPSAGNVMSSCSGERQRETACVVDGGGTREKPRRTSVCAMSVDVGRSNKDGRTDGTIRFCDRR